MRFLATGLLLALLAAPAFAEVTKIGEVQRNQPVTVEGVVDRFHDEDEIRLTDDTGSLRVYLGPQPAALKLGERIRVSGFMDDGLIMNELYAREIITEDGRVIVVAREYD